MTVPDKGHDICDAFRRLQRFRFDDVENCLHVI
jgi:hypothetical protein